MHKISNAPVYKVQNIMPGKKTRNVGSTMHEVPKFGLTIHGKNGSFEDLHARKIKSKLGHMNARK